MKIAIIGGGAAGFFSAIAVKENYPDADVSIFEKSNKLLAKVKISGGGRCNLTNGCKTIKQLSEGYPRGGKFLKKAFKIFNNFDAMKWFEKQGVAVVIQKHDNCVFPKSQNSQSIIDCFLNEANKLQIKIELNQNIESIEPQTNKILVNFADKTIKVFDKVIVATGGSPQIKGFDWLKKIGHKIESPVPSLFTFNMPNENNIRKLMGIVVENSSVTIPGTKLKATGALLITHWGMSGPVILKLSSFGARILNEKKYEFNILVNWVNEKNYDIVISKLNEIENEHSNKILANFRPYLLPERLWLYLLEKANISSKKKWCELGKKGKNKIANLLTNDTYAVRDKTSFRDEFVTCGGVSLEEIDVKTMQSKLCKNLYFAGEVLDIDGITGGYNFQAAWTSGFIAGKLL